MNRSKVALGYAALTLTALLWAGFAIAMRAIGQSELTPIDAALIRFAVPTLLLSWRAPALWRKLRQERWWVSAAIVFGAGLPHFLLSQLGGRMTGAAQVGVVVPGLVPLALVLLSFMALGRSPRHGQGMAVLLMSLGVLVSFVAMPGSSGLGLGVMSAAAALWACYTLAVEAGGFAPLDIALLIAAPNAMVAAVLESTQSEFLSGAPLVQIATAVGMLGLGSGILSGLMYAFGVRQVGAGMGSAVGALSPIIAAVAATYCFGESMMSFGWLGMAALAAGTVWFRLSTRQYADPSRSRSIEPSSTSIRRISAKSST